MNPRTILATALGAEPGGGCRCACCGPSPFTAAGAVGSVLGANFTDHEALTDPGAGEVCAGCQLCLSGRPGRKPPPLRTISVRVDVERPELFEVDQAGWWCLLAGEDALPAAGAVLSWATSRKRHHWLRAGISTGERWAVGADHGTIEWAFDPGLAAAILSLRAIGVSKGAILAGIYPPRLAASHLDRVLTAEKVLTPLRGQLILDLAVWAAPKIENTSPPTEVSVIDPNDAAAAGLVAEIVWGSEIRATDGKIFWAGYLIRRLRRFARLPLHDLISRLIGECRVSAGAAASAAGILDRLSAEEVAGIEQSVRSRTDLIHALAFDRIQGIRAERGAKKETS